MAGNVKEMLLIGKDCGLETLSEAFQNYMNHYDAFFSIANYKEEMTAFTDEMIRIGFVTNEMAGEYLLKGSLTIEQCLRQLDAYERAGA